MQNKQEEIILVRYYNVNFYLKFRVGVDEFRRDSLVERINGGEKMRMKDIFSWCMNHRIPIRMKFFYRKDFSVTANIWNMYSYCRFRIEIWDMYFNG